MAAAAEPDRPEETPRGGPDRSRLFLVFVGVFVVFFAQNLLGLEVFAPNGNDRALGVSSPAEDPYPSSDRHGDFMRQFVPRLHQQLEGDHAAWLATWDQATELGRPVMHGGGYSLVFPPTNLLARLHDDPLRLYTQLVMITLFLCGTFAFLSLREMGLHPAAAIAAALAASLGTRSIYWITFHQFHVPVCGAFALLWLSLRFLRSGGAGWLVAVAFAVHCMLLAGRLQMNVAVAYVLAPVLLSFLWTRSASGRAVLASGAWLAVAALAGAITVLPVFADLYRDASESARFATDVAFFARSRPALESLAALGDSAARYLSPALFGNAIGPGYVGRLDGSSPGPVALSLAAAAVFVVPWRRAWIWLLPLGFFFGLAASETLFSFAIRHLGFSFSRGNPLFGALVPLVVVGGLAADALVRRPPRARRFAACAAMLALPALVAVSRSAAGATAAPFDPSGAACVAAVVAAVVLFGATGRPAVLIAAAVAAVFLFSHPLRLSRARETVRLDSPLGRSLRDQLGPGERYAKLAPVAALIPSNQERLLGVRSVHGYNSLSTRRYQRLAERLSPWGTQTHGRHFDAIGGAGVLASPELGFAAVSVVLAPHRLANAAWQPKARVAGSVLHRSATPRTSFAQLAIPPPAGGASLVVRRRLERAARLPAEKTSDLSDRQTYRVTPAADPTLLFVSQQYHPAWRARSGGGTVLATRAVNDFYLGVDLPPGTRSVSLRFEPFARWMWAPQLGFGAAGLALAIRAWRSRGASRPAMT